ncbi:exodeoxyribonuclease V subunit beta [Reyranella sp.]|uniref:UvrD-helicase domain-containing protein n=1 Tax=Reyranella sp. TaxID=1929291 RepID=UPI0011FAE912|nr:UvrD-helicase domain-containing protein [Reyranella sp.]TAJ81841.1 MAG: DNA helicase UvrD [Reyranella sp.]
MKSTPDDEARERALTDLDSTLLVEASAGTGKTSLLAGRVAMLLAAGRRPSTIAAITFTERAAAELRERVDKFARLLVDRKVPKDLELAFRRLPLSDEQVRTLGDARTHLGELTASTIHSFCLSILQSYAVEARIDPGAVVMDGDQADLAFASIFDSWLSQRLGPTARPNDPIVVMAAHDPVQSVKTLKALAKFRRSRPEARPLPPPRYADAIHDFIEAVGEYRRWINRVPAPNQAVSDVEAIEELANALAPATSVDLDFGQLWPLVHPEGAALRPRKRELKRYNGRLKLWSSAAGKIEGRLLSAAGQDHYDRCAKLFSYALGAIADALLASFFGETDELVAAFEQFKRNAAVLDFDDILIRTRHLLRTDARVRAEVAQRYKHILIDEYQDTDPLQSEVLFLISGDPGPSESWDSRRIRPGALFMVGDPKQAIYRFRGADLKSYLRARSAIRSQAPSNVIQVAANFRSGKSILAHVDRIFAERLTIQLGDYVALTSTVLEDPGRLQSIARLSFHVSEDSYVSPIRDLEAKAIADLCASLVGTVRVRRSDGTIALAEPGDIALLAPRRTELWRYERALEERGLPVASQAGKNLYLRQETQDFVALVRALADSRDTLALGAVLRGPLVGLTEGELLDITHALREQDEEAVLDLRTDLSRVNHPLARHVMESLQELWHKRRATTPYALLSEAIERLRVTPSVVGRAPDQRARALGNINSLLERSRDYHVRGLKELAIDLSAEWDSGLPTDEAEPDHQRSSIEIVTVHKAKGLEWPIVIPINFVTMPGRDEDFFFRSIDNSVHWTLGDVFSSTLDEAIAAHEAEEAEENERLLYVACTRALDLLVLPAPSWAPKGGWMKFFDFGQSYLKDMKQPSRPGAQQARAVPQSDQSASVFAEERERIERLNVRIEWRRPSRMDIDRELLDRADFDVVAEELDSGVKSNVVGGGALRGIVLHKLMEELLTGIVKPDQADLRNRAAALMSQVVVEGAPGPEPSEMADTALRTFTHDELKPYIAKLVPEIPLYGARSEMVLTAARADAVAFEGGVPTAVFDWKSDVSPTPDDHVAYVSQLLEYLELTGVAKGAVVYMTSGEVRWVHDDGRSDASET